MWTGRSGVLPACGATYWHGAGHPIRSADEQVVRQERETGAHSSASAGETQARKRGTIIGEDAPKAQATNHAIAELFFITLSLSIRSRIPFMETHHFAVLGGHVHHVLFPIFRKLGGVRLHTF